MWLTRKELGEVDKLLLSAHASNPICRGHRRTGITRSSFATAESMVIRAMVPVRSAVVRGIGNCVRNYNLGRSCAGERWVLEELKR